MKVVFFGQIKEVLGVSQIEDAACCENVAQLRMKLQLRGENWLEYLSTQRSLVAVNHVLTDDNHELSKTDEVAFFPPVTGG